MTMFAARVLPVEAGQLLEGHAEAVLRVIQLKLVGIVDDHAPFPDFFHVAVVGFLVEGDEDVQFVAGAEDAGGGHPRLRPGGAAEDLGGEGGEGLDVVAGLGCGLGQGFGGGNNALASFAGESYYEIFSNQGFLQICEDVGAAKKAAATATGVCSASAGWLLGVVVPSTFVLSPWGATWASGGLAFFVGTRRL